MSKQMKRNNSVPEEIDRLPEIQMKRKEGSMIVATPFKEEEKKSNKGSIAKNLDESFKKYKVLDIIKEDKDDDYFKY